MGYRVKGSGFTGLRVMEAYGVGLVRHDKM